MGAATDSISPELRSFIEAQHVFFVASAPDGPTGHVNCSPKGMDTFRVLSPTRVAYLDLTGSGNETAAHLVQNGRITFMFCAFEGRPKILRLYGAGRVVGPDAPEWANLAPLFPELRSMFAPVARTARVRCTTCTQSDAHGRRVSRQAHPSQREGQGFESP